MSKQYRGGVVSLTDHMNDARVDGTPTFTFSVDAYGVAASEWGKMKVDNKNGSWDGPCTGCPLGMRVTASRGPAGSPASGDYDGYTYYKQTSRWKRRTEYAKARRGRLPGRAPQARAVTTAG